MSRLILLLVALAALFATLTVAQPMVNGTEQEVPPRIVELIKDDKVWQAEQVQREGLIGTKLEGLETIYSNEMYNYQTATKLFWHSVSAYCQNTANLAKWNCASCKQFGPFTVTNVMSVGSNQGYVGYFTQSLPASPISPVISNSGPYVLVSFRGTVPSKIANWIQDLSFIKKSPFSRASKVKVHSGFFDAYNNLKNGMLSGLKTALAATNAKTILFTGHSLGAAMAQIAAFDTKLNYYPNLNFGVYTQGGPRVGDDEFVKMYTQMMSTSFREIHQKDVVAHLPPMSFGFSHEPLEVFFNEDFKSYRVCNDTMSGESKKCSNQFLLPTSISDHTHYRNIEMGGYCNSKSMEEMETLQRAEALQPVEEPSLQPNEAEEPAVQAPAPSPSQPQVVLKEF